MPANYTDISILLDASASMSGTRHATREALVSFIKTQQKLPGEAKLTLAEFDQMASFRYVHLDVPLATIVADDFTYDPLGPRTALNDAWYRVIDERGYRLRNMPEASRPDKVVIVVITDGHDNNSILPKSKVLEAVKHQEQKYNWKFIYLGANQDAVKEGAGYGVSMADSMTYAPQNVNFASAAFTNKIASYRETGVLRSFTESERATSVGEED